MQLDAAPGKPGSSCYPGAARVLLLVFGGLWRPRVLRGRRVGAMPASAEDPSCGPSAAVPCCTLARRPLKLCRAPGPCLAPCEGSWCVLIGLWQLLPRRCRIAAPGLGLAVGLAGCSCCRNLPFPSLAGWMGFLLLPSSRQAGEEAWMSFLNVLTSSSVTVTACL